MLDVSQFRFSDRGIVPFSGVHAEESPERSVEPVCSQHRQQGGDLLGGQRAGLPGQHAHIPLSDQLARHH